MPRKRKHSDEEEEEEPVETGNGVRGKRRAAMDALAKAKVVAHDSDEEDENREDDEEDDEDDEDFEGEVDEEDDEAVDSKENGEEAEDDDENEGDEDDEDVDADAIKVDCIEAVLEEPSKDVEGYSVLKKDEKAVKKLEMWFSEEMSETIGDITEAFSTHYESKKLPVLQVTKFDVIEETDEIYQIDVLEAKYDKAYSIREKKQEKDETNLGHDLYCLVRVDGSDKTWATQYFMPEED